MLLSFQIELVKVLDDHTSARAMFTYTVEMPRHVLKTNWHMPSKIAKKFTWINQPYQQML